MRRKVWRTVERGGRHPVLSPASTEVGRSVTFRMNVRLTKNKHAATATTNASTHKNIVIIRQMDSRKETKNRNNKTDNA